MHLQSRSLCKVLFVLHSLSLVLSQSYNEKSFSTSISGMVELLETEMQLIYSVENYAIELQKKVDALENLVHELKEENLKSIDNREEYLYNPLNGFALIRRMQNDWPLIEMYMTRPVGEINLDVIRRYRPEMPTAIDLEEASEAINRLQVVYDLKAGDLAQGILNGKQYEAKWKSIDSYFMGYYLFNKKDYYPAGFWLYSSLVNYEENSIFNDIIGFGKEKPFELYAETLLAQNRPKDALNSIIPASNLQPMDARLLNRKNQIEYLANTNVDPPIQYPEYAASNYELGCRGQFSNQTSNMFCSYDTITTPFLRLAPLKKEILHVKPDIVLFHDVISDREIEHLKNLAKPNLKRATVFSEQSASAVVMDIRTSKFSWLKDNTDEVTRNLNERVIDMTGLHINDAEMLQVGNYGLGGHYVEHYDVFDVIEDNPEVAEKGDRIATVLFYLSDVEQGGATVFPNIQTAIFPRKGSAVMWYNLHNDGQVDYLTLHAACPVIVGSKWVCNKWIRSNAQMFRKPCYKKIY